MKRQAFLFLFALFLAGCGKSYWLSKYYVYLAEQINYKAHVLRTKPNALEERKRYHKKACDYFLKAYHINVAPFNFVRCEYAAQSCDWADDVESAKKFRTLQENYREPEEYEPAALPSG